MPGPAVTDSAGFTTTARSADCSSTGAVPATGTTSSPGQSVTGSVEEWGNSEHQGVRVRGLLIETFIFIIHNNNVIQSST